MIDQMKLTLEWQGTDGTRWDLLQGPVRALTTGIRGLGMPEVDYDERESAALDGQATVSSRLKPRTLFIPFRFLSKDVVGVQREFWRSMTPGQYGSLVVGDGMGGTRSIQMKFIDDSAVAYSRDPHQVGQNMGVTFRADDPWYRGEVLRQSLEVEVPTRPAFGEAPGDPVLYISSSYGNSRIAKVQNPGDAEAWPVWRITATDEGGIEAFELYIGDSLVSGDPTIPEGHVLTIDTDPRVQTAILSGPSITGSGNVTETLDNIDFRRIDSGVNANIQTVLLGNGVVEMDIVPLYYRAF